MSEAATKLDEMIRNLRSKVRQTEDIIEWYRVRMEGASNDFEGIILPALISVEHYYTGEIARVKSDMADWMSGHDVKAVYADSKLPPEIFTACYELYGIIANSLRGIQQDPRGAFVVIERIDKAREDLENIVYAGVQL